MTVYHVTTPAGANTGLQAKINLRSPAAESERFVGRDGRSVGARNTIDMYTHIRLMHTKDINPRRFAGDIDVFQRCHAFHQGTVCRCCGRDLQGRWQARGFGHEPHALQHGLVKRPVICVTAHELDVPLYANRALYRSYGAGERGFATLGLNCQKRWRNDYIWTYGSTARVYAFISLSPLWYAHPL